MRAHSDLRQSLPKAILYVAIGMMSFATAFGSLAQKSEPVTPAASIDATPASVVDGAFANFSAPSASMPAAGRARVQSPCNDFEFSFLNSSCLKFHSKRAAIHNRAIVHRSITGVNTPTKTDIQTAYPFYVRLRSMVSDETFSGAGG